MPSSTTRPSNVDKRSENVKKHSSTPDLSVVTKPSRSSKHNLRELRELSELSDDRNVNKSSREDRHPSRDGAAQRAAGDVVGLKDYKLGDCLGKGAFGSVYRALNWGTGETVAIKQIRLADLPKGADTSLQLEIDLLKNLNHSNIVRYHGFVKSVESLYIILEYCENGSLHTICKNFGKFPENLVAIYMSQVLYGLLYLHEQGVIHRDIKGANILTTKEGTVKLADFGVAARKDGLHESSVVGTPYWMAPEVIELAGATTASDIWSLGCTVIELLDGKPPYHKLQPMPALFRIVNDEHPPLPEGASPAVRDFLMQCFQKDPNLRVSAKKLLKHPWIMSAKRSDAVITKPTKYDEAVKSVQEWNEALKSPNNSFRRTTRQAVQSPTPRKDQVNNLQTPVPGKGALDIDKIGQRTNTKLYQSPEENGSDNWDNDFATPITSNVLKLPHMKPHDNFAGKLSSEKLKAYANHDGTTEVDDWDENFEGDLTVKSPMELANGDAIQTVKPFFPSSLDEIDVQKEVSGTVGKNRRPSAEKRKSSRESQPKTQILRPSHKKSMSKVKTPLKTVRQPSLFRERSVEDYSDLIAADDIAFRNKILALQGQKDDSFSPRLFHPSDLQSLPRAAARPPGAMRRSSVQASERADVHRSNSLVEIQKYAENARDEDFSDIFGKDSLSPKQPQSEHDSSSDRGTLMMLNSKLSTNSWLGDEEDDDDPFAQLEESFDELDLETNIARDKHARLCTLVEGLVGSLNVDQGEDLLADITDQLMQVLYESADIKSVIISAHGMLPILEILEASKRPDTVLRLLKIVNMLLLDNVELQENICFVGGIPIITKFAENRYSSDIRLEAAAFVRQMFQTSTLTLQMFVSCGGLNVLVNFLEEDYEAERDLVLIGVNGIWSVFELQGPTPKNDFCRIFSRSNVLSPLSLVLNKVLEEEGELAELVQSRIVNIFLLFSQAENHVKETVADRMVLKRVLKDLRRMAPANQVTMLKFIKNLSMLATTLDPLQNSNAIDVLTDLLDNSMKLPHFREISNQVLNIMYNLCRLSKERQEDAALNGVIPLLQRIVQTERPLKEFALPILCDMAHSGRVCRKILWQNKGLQFYVSLLSDQYWQVTALDAIFIWLQEETARVEEQLLLSPAFPAAIVECFLHGKPDSFENLLEPLQKLLRLSPPVAASLAHPDLFSRTVHKLQSKKALVRLNLLRIIRSICDASDEDGQLIASYGLYTAIADLAKHDQAILVREMASDLIKSSEINARRSADGVRRTLRRSSSSTMNTMTPSSSLPPTPSSDRGTPHALQAPPRPGSYFEMADLTRAMRPLGLGTSVSSPYHRPVSRDGSDVLLSPVSMSGAGTSLHGLSALSGHVSSGPASSRLENGHGHGYGHGHTHGHSNSSGSLTGVSVAAPGTGPQQKSRLPRTRPLRHVDRFGLSSAASARGSAAAGEHGIAPVGEEGGERAGPGHQDAAHGSSSSSNSRTGGTPSSSSAGTSGAAGHTPRETRAQAVASRDARRRRMTSQG